MRKVVLKKGRLTLVEDQILGFLERKVTPFGNSAKVDCPKEHIGRRAYLIIVK
jgi:putative transposon-encoded protein